MEKLALIKLRDSEACPQQISTANGCWRETDDCLSAPTADCHSELWLCSWKGVALWQPCNIDGSHVDSWARFPEIRRRLCWRRSTVVCHQLSSLHILGEDRLRTLVSILTCLCLFLCPSLWDIWSAARMHRMLTSYWVVGLPALWELAWHAMALGMASTLVRCEAIWSPYPKVSLISLSQLATSPQGCWMLW